MSNSYNLTVFILNLVTLGSLLWGTGVLAVGRSFSQKHPENAELARHLNMMATILAVSIPVLVFEISVFISRQC